MSYIEEGLYFVFAEIVQLGERQTEDLKVPGSNPESSHELWIIPGLGSTIFLEQYFEKNFFFLKR